MIMSFGSKLIVLILILSGNFKSQAASVKQEFLNQLNSNQSPQDIYATLIDQQALIFASPGSLIQAKVNANELTTWNELTNTAQEYVNSKTKQYSSSFLQLQNAFKFFMSALNQIKTTRLTAAGRDALVQQLNDQFANIQSIRAQALSSITNSYRNKYPQSWEMLQPNLQVGQLPLIKLDIAPYSMRTSDFLDKFAVKNILDSLRQKTLTPQAFHYIMSLHGITQDQTLLNAIDTLEGSLFRLSNISSSLPIYGQRKAIAQMLIDHLHAVLPTKISTLEQAQLDVTNDKNATLVFALAQTYGSLIYQLIKEISPA